MMVRRNKGVRIVLIGSGSSTGVPNIKCLLNGGCKVCCSNLPRNRRNNVGAIITTNEGDILIDCGKTFGIAYENYIKVHLPKDLPNILLTHSHADAIGGLDYIYQALKPDELKKVISNEETLNYLDSNYKYLFKNGLLRPLPIKNGQSITINGLNILVFELQHGDTLSLAFIINDEVGYISDCSDVPTHLFMNLTILFIDCNVPTDRPIKGHLNIYEVRRVVEICKPKRVILIGLSHEMDYYYNNLGYEMGYDGMIVNHGGGYFDDIKISSLYPYGPAAPLSPLASAARFDPLVDPLGLPARAGLAYSAAARARVPV